MKGLSGLKSIKSWPDVSSGHSDSKIVIANFESEKARHLLLCFLRNADFAHCGSTSCYSKTCNRSRRHILNNEIFVNHYQEIKLFAIKSASLIMSMTFCGNGFTASRLFDNFLPLSLS